MALTHSQKRWHENHERLYQAALREIEKVGFNDVRIEKICEETNLSRPTFYAHFTNKDSIVSEMLQRFMDGISRELEARTKGIHGDRSLRHHRAGRELEGDRGGSHRA